MTTDDALRYARQIALSEIGPEGQERLLQARALVVGDDLAADIATDYLAAAGVRTIHHLDPVFPRRSGSDWLEELPGVSIVVRVDFDDDALAGAATRLGLPLVAIRVGPDVIDLISIRRRAPSPDAPLDPPTRLKIRPDDNPLAVVAGTLAASEALQILLQGSGPDTGPPIRHLRLPLDGGAPLAQQIGAR
jgi:hypothetical protein